MLSDTAADKKIVEINGVKIEVDLARAKVVSSYKVGDTVQLLIRSYGDTYSTYPGIIVGFYDFAELPTINIAYIETSYSEGVIKFASINSKSKDISICAIHEYEFPYEKKTIMDKFNVAIEKKEEELRELKGRREFFLANFGKYFKSTEQVEQKPQ